MGIINWTKWVIEEKKTGKEEEEMNLGGGHVEENTEEAGRKFREWI